ncbi:MAG: hypothetical protein K0R05_496 [Anaerocolumna sp.]|jgi:hypothetical protein|nr:hypothetical protein [Anaerocolumna sp.]
MNLKYYVRGIGVGILFSAVVMSVAFHGSSPNGLSDEQIIARAKELGMVESNAVNALDDLLTTPTPTEIPQENGTEESDEAEEVPVTEDKKDDADQLPEASDESTTDDKNGVDDTVEEKGNQTGETSTDNTASRDNETSKNDSATVDENPEDTLKEIVITEGMSSEKVTRILKENGVIEDAGAFNQYLIINNYSRRIRVGTYQIKPYATYKDITDMIIH